MLEIRNSVLTVFPTLLYPYSLLFAFLNRYFIDDHSSIVEYCYPLKSLSVVPDNPVFIVANKLKRFFSNIKVGDRTLVFSQIEDMDNANQQVERLNVQSGFVGVKFPCKSLSGRVLQNLHGNGDSFVVSGTEVDFFLPPSSQSHPIRHKLVAVHTCKEDKTASEVKAEVDSVLQVFTKKNCSHLVELSKETGCKSVTQANLVTSETIQLKCGKQTAVQEKCIFCRLERHYLGQDISPQVCTDDLFQRSTRLYHKERLLLSCGVLDGKVLNAKTYPERTVGWLMEVNLDHLAMALFGIPDIRLLWSSDARFKEQFSVLKVRYFYGQLVLSVRKMLYT